MESVQEADVRRAIEIRLACVKAAAQTAPNQFAEPPSITIDRARQFEEYIFEARNEAMARHELGETHDGDPEHPPSHQ